MTRDEQGSQQGFRAAQRGLAAPTLTHLKRYLSDRISLTTISPFHWELVRRECKISPDVTVCTSHTAALTLLCSAMTDTPSFLFCSGPGIK